MAYIHVTHTWSWWLWLLFVLVGVRWGGLVITAVDIIAKTSYLTGNDTLFYCCHLSQFIFLVKMTTNKSSRNHNAGISPDVRGATSGFHVRRLFPLSNDDYEVGEWIMIGRKAIWRFLDQKKWNPILNKKSILKFFHALFTNGCLSLSSISILMRFDFICKHAKTRKGSTAESA